MKKYKLIKIFPGVTNGLLNEVFDTISTEDGHLIKFYDYLLINPSQWPEFFEEIKEPLFITEDGVEIFDENVILNHVTRVYRIESVSLEAILNDRKHYIHVFTLIKNAQDWIEENKPVYSKKQILEAIAKTSSGMPHITDKWHMMIYRDEFKKELGL